MSLEGIVRYITNSSSSSVRNSFKQTYICVSYEDTWKDILYWVKDESCSNWIKILSVFANDIEVSAVEIQSYSIVCDCRKQRDHKS